MSTLDLIMLAPIAFGAFKGYSRGLIIEAFGVLAFILGIIIGFKFLFLGAGLVENIIGPDRLRWLSPYLSFFIVFLPSMYLIRLVGMILKKTVRLTPLGALDGIFGAAIGAVTATFGLSLVLLLVQKIGISLPLEESKFYPYISDFAPKTISFVSDLIPGGNWLEYLKSLKGKLNPV